MVGCGLRAHTSRFFPWIASCSGLLIVLATVYFAASTNRPTTAASVDDKSLQGHAAEEGPWPFGEKSVSQSDPRLVTLIREKYTILPPVPDVSPSAEMWGNPNTTRYSKFNIVEDKMIPLLFRDENGRPLREGTFLESGSLGKEISATLYMERFLGWKGLIAEMAPPHIQAIVALKRYNSVIVPACVAPVPWPTKTNYTTAKADEVNVFVTLLDPNGIDDGKEWADTPEKKKNLHIGKVDCFPLFSILLAANHTKIDFANLSFGGLESDVLETIPFDKVDIKVILFSLNNVKKQPPLIHEVMLRNGYIQVPPKLIIIRDRDPVYVRRDWAIEKKLSFV